jgi:phosphatidylglycerophosphatase A
MRKYIVPTIPESMWQNPWHFIAFGFGSGALPIAPGTFGTLLTIPFYLVLQNLSVPLYCIAVLIITLASMWLCERVTNEIHIHDHQGMCLDEFVGFLVTMIYAPHGWLWVLIGFGLFRLFDIWKPWPIKFVDEKVGGGVGIILDDVLAGIYSMIIIQLFARVL